MKHVSNVNNFTKIYIIYSQIIIRRNIAKLPFIYVLSTRYYNWSVQRFKWVNKQIPPYLVVLDLDDKKMLPGLECVYSERVCHVTTTWIYLNDNCYGKKKSLEFIRLYCSHILYVIYFVSVRMALLFNPSVDINSFFCISVIDSHPVHHTTFEKQS